MGGSQAMPLVVAHTLIDTAALIHFGEFARLNFPVNDNGLRVAA